MTREFHFPKRGEDITSSSGLGQELGAMGIEVDRTFALRAHLSSLRGHVSKGTIQLHREGLKGFNLLELQQIAQMSNEMQWTSRPAYYCALLEEIDSRDEGTSVSLSNKSPSTPLTLL